MYKHDICINIMYIYKQDVALNKQKYFNMPKKQTKLPPRDHEYDTKLHQMLRFKFTLGSGEYPFIAITPRSTLTKSGST